MRPALTAVPTSAPLPHLHLPASAPTFHFPPAGHWIKVHFSPEPSVQGRSPADIHHWDDSDPGSVDLHGRGSKYTMSMHDSIRIQRRSILVCSLLYRLNLSIYCPRTSLRPADYSLGLWSLIHSLLALVLGFHGRIHDRGEIVMLFEVRSLSLCHPELVPL